MSSWMPVPLILNIFAEYFGNPLTWVFTGIFIALGVILGVFLKPWFGNQVQKFIPSDHRFIDFDIDEETAVSIQCKKKKGYPLQRFFKYHPGFTGVVGKFLKKPVTRFLGIEGTAYTWSIEEGKQKLLGTLAEAVRTVWGEDFFATVPARQRSMMEESRIQVTVGLDESPLTPTGMRVITEEDVKGEEDRQASKTFWSQHKEQMKGFLINLLLAGGTGFGLALFLMMIGIIKFPTSTPTPAPAEAIATIIRSLIH